MSRQRHDYLHPQQPLQAIGEEAQARAQAADSFTLVRAKELLCELWRAGRIQADVRFLGEGILCAALHAIENPSARGVSQRQGMLLIHEQFLREQEARNREF